ncbi:MAG: phasin family protein [Beijerinckiaceae bacterium]|jgi:phasin family protein|nr:phasin family protein [Beijerinckiaceae bacterium]MDO9440503.1 phasin family protein [Beijerinckiaceae bacterium]
MFKNLEEMQKFSKDQMDSAAAAATTLSKSVQQIAIEATDYSKKSLETSTQFVEKLLGAKSLDSAVQIQSEYAKSAYEGFVAQATKFGEMYTSLAKEAFKPVEAVVAKAQAVAK